MIQISLPLFSIFWTSGLAQRVSLRKKAVCIFILFLSTIDVVISRPLNIWIMIQNFQTNRAMKPIQIFPFFLSQYVLQKPCSLKHQSRKHKKSKTLPRTYSCLQNLPWKYQPTWYKKTSDNLILSPYSKLSRKKGLKLWFQECFVLYWIEGFCLFSRQERLCLYASQANILWLFKFPSGTGIFKNFPPQKRERYDLLTSLLVWFPRGRGIPPPVSPARKEVGLSEYLRSWSMIEKIQMIPE